MVKTIRYDSPYGPLLLGEYDGAVCMCDWDRNDRIHLTRRRMARQIHTEFVSYPTPLLGELTSMLDEYFDGKHTDFPLPMVMIGTEFQRRVWGALCGIDYGKIVTYRDIAVAIGRPTAVRAVAGAIGANPLSILIPCHRVIGADGTLTGYAGGLDAKALLLALEKRHSDC